jgi:SAM-dependent methyltransferase
VSLRSPFLDLGLQPTGPELTAPEADPAEDQLRPLRVAACASCGLVQLADHISPTAGIGHGHATVASTTLADHEHKWAADLVAGQAFGSRPYRVLDVSCGDGTLLRAVRTATAGRPAPLELLGFERDQGLALAAGRSGIETRLGTLEGGSAARLAAAGWLADLVIVSQALAHVDDPGELLDAVSTVLVPGGRLAIEAHHLLRVVAGGQFDAFSHAHAIYPSLGSLVRLMQPRGLAVTEVETVDVYGGSLRLVARRTSRRMPGATVETNSAVEAVRAEESAARLNDPTILADIGRRAERVAGDLRAFLVERRSERATVAGYGAPARAGILLNLAGIGPDLLPYTVDRNPAKQGMLIAGSRIPVFAPDRLDSPRPDYVLILPWTLQSEIARQLSPLREAGTRLVVALPELQVLKS